MTSPRTSDSDDLLAIGVDVGGTKVAAGLVRFPAGVLRDRRTIPTRASRGPEAVLADVIRLAGGLVEQARSESLPIAGVGIGVPELVDLGGRVASGQTIDWRGMSLEERLAPLGPVRIESDVRAAALGEALFGAGRSYRSFTYVTIGTGISSTVVLDGRPHAGARGNALVLGSAPLSTVCSSCRTVVRSVLEDVAAGPALVRRYNELRPMCATSAEDVIAAAAAGDPAAADVLRDAADALGSSVALLVNVLDPEAVIVGGGLGVAGGKYWDAFVRSTRWHIWAEATRRLPIVPAALGVDSGLIGAAAGVWRC
jgi:glucokinase